MLLPRPPSKRKALEEPRAAPPGALSPRGTSNPGIWLEVLVGHRRPDTTGRPPSCLAVEPPCPRRPGQPPGLRRIPVGASWVNPAGPRPTTPRSRQVGVTSFY